MTGEKVISFEDRTWLIKDILIKGKKMYIVNPKESSKNDKNVKVMSIEKISQ